MIAITIDPVLKAQAPALVLGCISATVTISPHDEVLWREIDNTVDELAESLAVEDIVDLPEIAAQRDVYKAIGKNPSRYRGSSEALLRRIAQDKGLYQVNTLVDINNLLSLESRHPVGSYDLAQVQAPLMLTIGQPGANYQGIGKGEVNIENLPVLADSQGLFGSPTSDSQRALIGLETQQVLMVFYAFSGVAGLELNLLRAENLLWCHLGAEAAETWISS